MVTPDSELCDPTDLVVEDATDGDPCQSMIIGATRQNDQSWIERRSREKQRAPFFDRAVGVPCDIGPHGVDEVVNFLHVLDPFAEWRRRDDIGE